MTDQNDENLKPDPQMQKRFNVVLVILMAMAGVLFFWVEPQLFETGAEPLLGDIYKLKTAYFDSYNISENMAQRLAFKSDFYLVLFLVMLGVSFFLPVGASRSVMVKRFLLDYSIKCRMEFYVPYISMVVFLAVAVWVSGYSFADYEANSRTSFVDASLTKVAPFLAVLAASMIAAIIKGVAVFGLVLRELGAPEPDIANVPDRYILPWGLKKQLFKHVMERTALRFPDRKIRLYNHGFLPWGLGLGLPALAIYNLASDAPNTAPVLTSVTWFIMGLVMLPLLRRLVFDMTGQSISLATRIGLVASLLMLSMCFTA